MTSSVSSTGSISSTGLGSGLDVNSIISKLMSVEKVPLTALQNQASTIQSSISAYGAVKSATAAMRDAALALTRPNTWSATTASSSDATSVTASTGIDAVPGTYAVTVSKLAAAQSTASGTYASSSSLVGIGTVHIDLGTWNAGNTAFTAQAGNSGVDFNFTSTDTLATMSAAINAANAGVSASIVTDTSGARLVLTSSATGSANGFRVAINSLPPPPPRPGFPPNGDLNTLAYMPDVRTSATTLTQAAANAAATVNGLAVSSATNTLSGVVQGLTLNLLKVSASPVQITVAQDTASIKAGINKFVSAYNSLSSLLATDTKYDAATTTAGPLQADATAVSLQRQLRSILGSSSNASSAFSTLSQAGLQIQSDGSIGVNDTTLTNALANPTQIKALFAASNTTSPADAGFGRRFSNLGDSVLSLDGSLSARVSGLSTSLNRNQADQDKTNTHLTSVEARLRAQYSALDSQMASINALSTYVTQQITNWNKSS